MGNLMATRPPQTATLGLPAIRTPLTDICAPIGHRDGDEECLPFQLRWIDCGEAYGKEMMKEKCKFFYQDFVECTKQWKRRARLGDMMERHYQLWFQGVMGKGPSRPLYNETPRYDGFVPNFLYDDRQWK